MHRVGLLFDYIEMLTPKPEAFVNRLLDDQVGHIRSSAELMGVGLGSTDGLEANFHDFVNSMPETAACFSHRPMSPELFEVD